MSKLNSILIRVIFPVCMDSLLYYYHSKFQDWPFITNYGADLLWAFGLLSALQIIWDGKIPFLWMILTAFLFILFEYAQANSLIGGHYDPMDILCYFFAGCIAILIDRGLKTIKKYET